MDNNLWADTSSSHHVHLHAISSRYASSLHVFTLTSTLRLCVAHISDFSKLPCMLMLIQKNDNIPCELADGTTATVESIHLKTQQVSSDKDVAYG